MQTFNNHNEAFEVLKSGLPEQRAEAIKYLGDNQYAPAVPILAQLVEESDPGTRYLAAQALAQLGDEAEAAVPSLLIALRADDMYLRVATTNALIKIGNPAVAGLTKALFDRNKAVRRASAKALGKIGNPRAINALEVAVKDQEPSVRKLCREALNRLQAVS
ncbi:MAG: HEAT repeat domain-containing protein [Phototrophicaceae bacterium]